MAVQGKPDRGFWQSAYKLDDPGSGDPNITGWITAFFPYLKDVDTGQTNSPNHYLKKGGENLEDLLNPIEERPYFGLTTSDFPSGLAKAPFIWNYFEQIYNMEFVGGFVGIQQDFNSLFLRPKIGWIILDKET